MDSREEAILHPDVDDINGQIQDYVVELENYKHQMNQLMQENARLTRELKEQTEKQLTGMSDADVLNQNDLVQNLQHQLTRALEEKEHCVNMWQLAQKEIERLEQESQNRGFNPQLQIMQQQAHKIKEQYLKTTEEMNAELKTLHSALETTREQLGERKNTVDRLQLELQEARAHIASQEQDRRDDEEEKEQLRKKISQLHGKLKDLESNLVESETARQLLKDDMKNLERQLTDLQRKCAAHEQFEFDAMNKVKTYNRAVEEATLERDQAIQKERQKQEEVEQLQKAISELMTEAAVRARQEIDNVKKHCNQTVAKCMEDIHNLELEATEKQTQFERMMREKRIAESELERYRRDEQKQLQKDTTALEDLMKRACNAERIRDETLLKIDGLQNHIKRLELGQKQERKQQENEIGRLRELNAQQSVDLDAAQKDRVQLQEQVAELQSSLAAAVRAKEVAQRNTAKLKSEMEHALMLKQKEIETRLEATEEGHRQSQNGTRQLLTAQQKATAKWKEECETIAQKYENKVQELQAELTQLRKRNAELSRLLHEMQSKVTEAEKMLSEYTRHIHKLEERMQLAEERARVTSNVTQNRHGQNRNIAEERRQMQRELERNFKEAKNLINSSMTENGTS